MSHVESEVPLDLPGRASDKTALLLWVAGGVVLLDVLTKQWIVQTFPLYHSESILGDVLRLTYTHNPGAAFGIHVGEHSRLFFLSLSLVALVVLGLVYRSTSPTDRLRLLAVALVSGGAVGNILDRLRYSAGVVDFVDVGIGSHRFPVFNVADSAVSIGAILLLASFYLEGREEKDGPEPEG
ncbi:MAG: signal peptidase II [Gemmatimonadota bacterium]